MKRVVINKLIIICLIVLYLICFVYSNVYASDNYSTNFPDENNRLNEKFITIISGIIRLVRIVAMGIAIIMLIILGIKYITESPNGRVEIKKSIMQYAIGAGILFGGAGILTIIQSFVDANKNI